jgi:hypothetical protein
MEANGDGANDLGGHTAAPKKLGNSSSRNWGRDETFSDENRKRLELRRTNGLRSVCPRFSVAKTPVKSRVEAELSTINVLRTISATKTQC